MINKLSIVILVYFISRVAMASPCEVFTGYVTKEKFCWDNTAKGWFSEKCQNQNCDAKKFFAKKQTASKSPVSVGGQNPAALRCHSLGLKVVILKDSSSNEQSFCVFPDRSMVDANAIQGKF